MEAESRQPAIEARGSTVEAAIETGLVRLGLSRSEVDLEILDEGSRGILGIGSRDAVVRLTPRQTTPPPPPPALRPASPMPPIRESMPVAEAQMEEALPFPQAATPQPPKLEHEAAASKTETGEQPTAGDQSAKEEDSDSYLEEEREAAILILTELLDKMRVRATISARLSESDELTGHRVNMLDITGDDLGALIGPRGDTLDALQYVSRLIVAHRLHRRANFLVDVEGFRERREQALVRLAERMADKVRQRQEPITLEAMPPYERRIIHMTLRNADGVYTESTGEGDRRKVRIYPQ